tara:strand:+ start:3269 stop:3898 length:630 start_codon:yes stop_codon:yes gene_type:complete
MHKINVLSFGSKNFNTSLEELKDFLSFKITTADSNFKTQNLSDFEVLFIHQDQFKKDPSFLESLKQINKVKILASNTKEEHQNFFSEKLTLPTSIKDLNQTIENSIAKKNFNMNSSIKIKDYILDKNQKKLSKKDKFIILTEKEIQLLELLSNNTKPINKKKILEEVWKYASDADTHTVETHIHRLRKKIKSEFKDEGFILNNKDGYLF